MSFWHSPQPMQPGVSRAVRHSASGTHIRSCSVPRRCRIRQRPCQRAPRCSGRFGAPLELPHSEPSPLPSSSLTRPLCTSCRLTHAGCRPPPAAASQPARRRLPASCTTTLTFAVVRRCEKKVLLRLPSRRGHSCERKRMKGNEPNRNREPEPIPQEPLETQCREPRTCRTEPPTRSRGGPKRVRTDR